MHVTPECHMHILQHPGSIGSRAMHSFSTNVTISLSSHHSLIFVSGREVWDTYMKRCSGSLTIGEVQVNHSEPPPHVIKVAIIKKLKDEQHWQDWRKGNLCTLLVRM